MNEKYYVYYDENYPSSWISEDSAKKIVEFFTSKYNFKEINSEELARVMNESLNIHSEVVVVFSQDVIPDTVVDNPKSPSENSLVKRFLLQGHTIVWMGDIPLLYLGHSKHEKSTLGRAGYNLFYPDLPSDFEMPDNPLAKSQQINITYYGALFGLIHRWDSWRPIPQNWSLPKPPLMRPMFYALTQYYTGTGYRFSSYIIDYGGYGFRGLIRLYDCKLPDISAEMLEQVARIIFFRNPTGIEEMIGHIHDELRKLKEDLEGRFDAIKSDLSRIGESIREALTILREKEKGRE